MILRELAAAWVKANCPSTDVQHAFLHQVDDALGRSVGCSLVIGQRLTKSGTPYLVHCFCGELFAFQLTPRQTARLKVNDSQLVAAQGLNQHDHEPHRDALVQLQQVAMDRANAHDLAEPITGTLRCHTDQWWALPLAIQAVCEPVGRSNLLMYHHLEQLTRGKNVVRFRLPPIGKLQDREGQPFSGVLPLFFQICIVGEPEKTSQTSLNGPGTGLAHGMPLTTPIVPPAQIAKQKLGERFVPPVPIPTLMTPETLVAPSFPTPWHPEPDSGPNPNRIRAISDIHAVFVEVA